MLQLSSAALTCPQLLPTSQCLFYLPLWGPLYWCPQQFNMVKAVQAEESISVYFDGLLKNRVQAEVRRLMAIINIHALHISRLLCLALLGDAVAEILVVTCCRLACWLVKQAWVLVILRWQSSLHLRKTVNRYAEPPALRCPVGQVCVLSCRVDLNLLDCTYHLHWVS